MFWSFDILLTVLIYHFMRTCTGGTIPSELCAISTLSIDVSDTDIDCYSGCLTSASVTIQGASSDCHDGSVTRDFLILVIPILVVAAIGAIVYRYRSKFDPSGEKPKRESGVDVGLKRSGGASIASSQSSILSSATGRFTDYVEALT